jgi:hypothetical protein
MLISLFSQKDKLLETVLCFNTFVKEEMKQMHCNKYIVFVRSYCS